MATHFSNARLLHKPPSWSRPHAALCLADCSYPVAALPTMRAHMTRLEVLSFGVGHCEDAHESVLVSVLVLLGRPHPGAVRLRYLECCRCPEEVDREECQRVVKEDLERDFGVRDEH